MISLKYDKISKGDLMGGMQRGSRITVSISFWRQSGLELLPGLL
jgi:hypothetical protein